MQTLVSVLSFSSKSGRNERLFEHANAEVTVLATLAYGHVASTKNLQLTCFHRGTVLAHFFHIMSDGCCLHYTAVLSPLTKWCLIRFNSPNTDDLSANSEKY